MLSEHTNVEKEKHFSTCAEELKRKKYGMKQDTMSSNKRRGRTLTHPILMAGASPMYLSISGDLRASARCRGVN